jgi:hypothetical protein
MCYESRIKKAVSYLESIFDLRVIFRPIFRGSSVACGVSYLTNRVTWHCYCTRAWGGNGAQPTSRCTPMLLNEYYDVTTYTDGTTVIELPPHQVDINRYVIIRKLLDSVVNTHAVLVRW